MAICDDSLKTRKSIADFSKYLRGNLDALNNDKLIPFSKELSHVETYLRLEKLRFEDALTIIYDVTATNFEVPALTVQVLVENAVKHGITKTKGSGYVKISTKELVKCFVITVEDNGQGFNVGSAIDDGKSHIGLKNITNRLHYTCNGKLTIESKINVGTTATVTIPKIN